jgi:hypothetical protein
MIDGVEADGDQVADALVEIDRAAIIVVGADAGRNQALIGCQRTLGHQVYGSRDVAAAAVDRVGAVGDLDLFDIVGFVAVEEGGAAHAVDSDVVLGVLPAQNDAVAIAEAALARAEGDAGHGLQHVAQGQQVLLLDAGLGDDRDRLRRIEQRRGVFRRFRAIDLDRRFVDHGVRHGDAAEFLLAILSAGLGLGGGGEGHRAHAGQGEKGRLGRRLLHVIIPRKLVGALLLRVVRSVNFIANHYRNICSRCPKGAHDSIMEMGLRRPGTRSAGQKSGSAGSGASANGSPPSER